MIIVIVKKQAKKIIEDLITDNVNLFSSCGRHLIIFFRPKLLPLLLRSLFYQQQSM